jgi:hypothetical protein
MPYLKFPSLANFDAFNARMNARLGLPNGRGTTTYTFPMPHPKDGSVAAWVNEDCPSEEMSRLSPLDRDLKSYCADPRINPEAR